MKDHWPRQTPAIDMDVAAVSQLVLPLFPGNRVVAVEPVNGGLTNTNLKVRLSDRAGALLLRIYQRGREPAYKEMAISRLIRDRVPLLHVIHFSEESFVGHPYAVLDWVKGTDLQHRLATIAARELVALGHALGRTLAAIHSFRFAQFGFFDAGLNVLGPIDFDQKGLVAYLDQSLIGGPGGARLGAALTAKLLDFAKREGHILESWLQQPCLVHGDFNGANIVIRENSGHSGFEIAAILDWEYALSATPAMDFGNLLRPPFDNNMTFADAVAEGYRDAGGFLPKDWKRIARLADVFSFADILSRPETSAIVTEDAKKVIFNLVESPS